MASTPKARRLPVATLPRTYLQSLLRSPRKRREEPVDAPRLGSAFRQKAAVEHADDWLLRVPTQTKDRQSARASTLPFPHSFRHPSVDQRQWSLQRPGSDFNMQSSCDPSLNVTAITEGAPDTRLRRKGSTESKSNSALLTSCSRTTNQACSPHHAANTISPPSSALDTA